MHHWLNNWLPHGDWPDGVDALALACFFAVVVGLPAIGYAALVADVRAWLRSFSRALAVASSCFPRMTGWARVDTPRCIAALGLALPCTEDDVLREYRRRVKQHHPDLGGDKKKFLRLQSHFEDAIRLLRQQPTVYQPAGE